MTLQYHHVTLRCQISRYQWYHRTPETRFGENGFLAVAGSLGGWEKEGFWVLHFGVNVGVFTVCSGYTGRQFVCQVFLL